MLSEAVRSGLEGGMNRFFKHADSSGLSKRLEEELCEKQHEYIMNAITNLFYYEEDE